jgi:3-phosphoshikimate 1-carboxyvinyltransferase
MKLSPASRIRGRIRLPGDKSISHRAALIAGLAEGSSRLSNFSTSSDCASTLACLEQLGAIVTRSGQTVTIDPPQELRSPTTPLDCGNSGSTMRMVAGILAGNNFTSELSGDDSLASRPMKRIIEPLEMMGATIASNKGKPPLCIHGSARLNPITYELPVASAQVKSCVLFAGLNALGQTTVIEPTTTRDHTERLFKGFGVPIQQTIADGKTRISIDGPARFLAGDMTIPGDISSAAYFIAASMLLPGSDLTIQDVGLNPTRVEFVSQLRDWGASIETTDNKTERYEPIGIINVKGGTGTTRASRTDQREARTLNEPRRIGRGLTPALIDELPLIAVVGSQLPGGLEIRDAAELRVKETDRITATVNNLRAMGAEVEEYDDGFFVNGPVKLHGALIDSYGDHRIAMAFSIAALIADSPSEISGASCVNISFPEFFELLHQIVEP